MTASERGSVSVLLAGLKAGDDAALAGLWDRYFRRVAALGRARLGRATAAADGDDIAAQALHSLVRGAAAGRFPKLDDRGDLWRVLACLAARKAAAVRRQNGRSKRGGDITHVGDDALHELLAEEPSPETLASLAELTDRLLESLGDDSLRTVALLKMEGLTNEEVAERLDCVPRTVERKLAIVRKAWIASG